MYCNWWMLIAGKGLGEDVRNGAAARPVVAAREGRQSRRQREPEALSSRDREGEGAVYEPSFSEPATSSSQAEFDTIPSRGRSELEITPSLQLSSSS